MTIANDWVTLATLLGAGAVTILARASFVIWGEKLSVPPWFSRALKFVAAAVLPALVMPEVLFRGIAATEMLNTYRIAAAVIALIVAWRTRNLLATLAAGMVALWALQWWRPW
jgi:branched-subunit amino acid transport protein